MPKPRGHKPRKRTIALSGLRDVTFADIVTSTADLAEHRLSSHLRRTDPADIRLIIGVPPLFLDLRAEQMQAPAGRCVDDCLILAHAYAQLGFTAQIRVGRLEVVDDRSGQTWTHGTATPRWQNDLLHGHTVIWLPDAHYLIDVTADQFPPLNESLAGPVVAPSSAGAETVDGFTARVDHAGLILNYTLAPWQDTRAVLNHPPLRDDEPAHRQRGINVAGAAIGLLAHALTPRRTRVLTHERTAALITAARQTTFTDDPILGARFRLTSPGEKRQLLALDELLLPPTAPDAAPIQLWPADPPLSTS